MKGKILLKNKKFFIFGIVAILILGIVASYIKINYDTSKKLATRENYATINNSWDPSGMNISSDDIVKKAIELANHTNYTYSAGCIGFVNTIIEGRYNYDVSGNKIQPAIINGVQSNSSLQSSCSEWGSNSTINKISATKAMYASTNNSMNGQTWWTTLGMDAKSLQVGDIIIGNGHAMIYLGQANSYSDLNAKLKSQYGVQFSGLTDHSGKRGVLNVSYYKQYPIGAYQVGSTYWTIDVNGSGGARVENYDWSDTSESAYSWNLNKMKVYRFKKREGSYHLNIAKRSTDNNTALSNKNNGIDGVSIKVEQTVYGKNATSTTVTTKPNSANSSIFGNTKIEDIGVGKPDTYKITEIKGANGYNTINLSDITFDVYKKISKNNSSKYVIDYVRVNRNGNEIGRVTNDEGDKNAEKTFKIDGDDLYDIGIEINKNGDSLCITVRNKPITGNYHINLSKRSSKNTIKTKADLQNYSDCIGGAEFNIKLYRNNTATANRDIKVVSNSGKMTRVNFDTSTNTDENSNILIDKIDTVDKMIIEETKAPTNFGKPKYTKFVMYVHKKLNDSKNGYVIDYVEIKSIDSSGKETAAIHSQKAGQFAINQAYNIAVDLSEIAITLTWIDPPLTGSYHMYIGKRDANNKNTVVGGAKFTVTKQRNGEQSGESKKTKNITTVTSGDNYADNGCTTVTEIGETDGTLNNKTQKNWENVITKTDAADVFTIEETDAPDGYKKNNQKFQLRVHKKVDNPSNPTKYVLSAIDVYENGIGTKISKDKDKSSLYPGDKIYIDKDYNLVEENGAWTMKIEMNEGAFTVYWVDEQLTGKYHMYVGKRDANNKNTVVGGAKFTVTKQRNGEQSGESKKTKNITTVTSGDNYADNGCTTVTEIGETDGTLNNKTQKNWENVITKIGEGTADVFTIEETDAPDGYKKNNQKFQLRVHKKVDNSSNPTRYVVSAIDVYKNGSETKISKDKDKASLYPGDEIYIDKDYNLVEENGAWTVKIEMNEGAFTVYWVDEQLTGDYKVQIKKVDQSNQPISGVKFKVNDKNFGPTDSNGVVTIANEKITKDNVEKLDTYTISEVDLGENKELVKLKQTISICVDKGLNASKDKYIATEASFEYGDTAKNNGKEIEQPAELEDGTKVNVKLSVKDGVVTVTIPNKKQDSYYLNIGKKSTGNKEFINDNNNDYIAGAKFSIEQYLNMPKYTSVAELTEKNRTSTNENIVSEDNHSTAVTFNSNNKINITDVETVDIYKLNEIVAPSGFKINNKDFYLKVYKTANNGKAVIDKIDVVELVSVNNGEYSMLTSLGNMKSTTDTKLWSGNAVYNFRVDLDKETNTITFTIGDPPKSGKYSIELEKHDVHKKKISNEKATFDVNVYSKMIESNGKVTFQDPVTSLEHEDKDRTPVKTKGIETTSGITKELNDISIRKTDINKTYYFVIEETQAPNNYIAIDYKIVLPISFKEEDSKYSANYETAFAVTKDNQKKSLSDMSKNANECVSTTSGTLAINVKVPNKTKEGSFNFKLIKYIEGTETPLPGAKFTVKITDEKGTIVKDSKNNEINGTKEYTTGNDGYFTEPIEGIKIESAGKKYTVEINETHAPDGYIGLTESVKFTATSEWNENSKAYILKTETPPITNKKASANITSNLISVKCYNTSKSGTYEFKLTKTDVSGGIIKDENTRFDVNVYGTMTESNGKVTFSNPITLKNTQGTTINTTGLTATTGVTTTLSGIEIQDGDIGKTYYFVVTETDAPDHYTAIDYKVVVPITYSERGNIYVATKGDAFAVIANNDKKQLDKMSTNINECASTEQNGVTINVKVPNKPKEGEFNFKLIKYIEGTKTPLKDAKFTVKITDESGNVLKDVNGNAIDGTKKYTTGEDGYFTEKINGISIESENERYTISIEETDVPEGYIGTDPVTFTAVSTFNEKRDGYILRSGTIDVRNEKINVTTDTNSINVEYYNEQETKSGIYHFLLTKTDVSGEVIKDEKTRFDVDVYSTIAESNGKATFSNPVTLKNEQGNTINTKGLEATTGMATTLSGISIQDTDIGKTYYFVVTETQAPDHYTAIDYKVVVPITYSESGNVYTATKGEAFAVTANNDKRQLDKMSTNINECASTEQSGVTINVKVPNKTKQGSFNFRLVKYKHNTDNLLSAGFKIKIENKANGEIISDRNGNKIDGTHEYFSSTNPKDAGIRLYGLNIDKENITYKITITETTAPEGYIGLAKPITFDAKSKWDNNTKTYKLEANNSIKIENVKLVDVKEDEVLVELENTPEPEIHKGVKDVKNQDSGYYDNVEHEWVVNSTVPLGIKDFTQYVVTDTIDNRLVFSGINKVSVRIKGGRTLVKDTDYKINYNDETRVLTISFIDGNFTEGQSLPENTTIEIIIKTKFKKENGKIIALNEEIPNQSTLIYNNGSGQHTKKSEKPEVHTGGIKVFKYEEVNGEKVPLEGATFKLATSEENARNNVFIKIKDANGKDTTTDIVGKSDANGIVVFEGLEFGGDAISNEANKTIYKPTGKDEPINSEVYDYEYNGNISTNYWVVETEAPSGYIKWNSPLKVTINKDSYNTEVSNMPSVPNTSITGKYSVQLKKVSKSNNPIPGAIFKISSANIAKANREEVTTDENGNLDITNGDVTILANDKETGNDSTKVGTTDNYNITESSATSYLKLENPLILSVYKKEQNNEYHVSKIKIKELYTTNEKTLTISDSNKSITLTGVKLIDNEKTVDITVSIDNNDNISVTVPNDDIEGKYNIKLLKKDSETGEALGKIPFLINGKQKETDKNEGTINVTEDAGENGIVKITKANVGKQDVYTIEEQENENTANVAIIKSPFTLTLTKGMNSDQDAYIVKRIHIDTITTYGEGKTDIEIDPNTHTGFGNFYVATKDGQNIKCTITINSTGEILLELGNPSKDGKYKLKLYKSIINNDNSENKLKGVQFKITDINEEDQSKNKDYPKTTAANGYTSEISKSITKDNVNKKDKFKITEKSATDDKVIKLKNSLTLEVTKRINNNNDGYTINTIKLSEDGTGKTTPEVSVDEETGATLTLNGVALLDGRTVDISTSVGNDEVITVNIKNREITGKYTLKIRKINSVTGEPLNGVTFNGLDRNQVAFSEVTKNDGTNDGIATIVEDLPIESSSDEYKINEVSLPDNIKGDFLQLTDYGLGVTVNTRINDAKTAYVVDNVELLPFAKNGSQTTEAQRAIIEKSTYDVTNNVITITIENEPTQDYNFTVKKVDMENNAIADAKFTIKENGNTILENAKLGELGEYLVNRENQLINKTYQYEIYETEPAPGYDNVLEKLYITLRIKIDEEGNVTASANCLPDYKNSGTIWERAEFQRTLSEYVKNNEGKKFLEDNGNNSWTLNIPNPRSTINTKFTLNKHEVNSENTVNGAQFGAWKMLIENEGEHSNLTEIIEKFKSGGNITTIKGDLITSSKKKNMEIDSIEGFELGDSYYYELYERKVPENYISTFDRAIVRVHANMDGTINATIVAIRLTNTDDYVPYEASKYQNILSVDTQGTTVNLNWTNSLAYTVKLNKKQFKGTTPKDDDGNTNWSGLQGLPGATFTVKQVSPEQKTIYDHQVLTDYQFFNNLEANSSTTYHYEIVEEASREGFTNIFEGLKIHLYITTNEDGTINEAPNATYYEIKDLSGNDISANKKKYLEDKIGLKVDGNIIDFYIANEEKTLKIALLKVTDKTDNNGNLIGIPGIEFGILGPNRLPIYDENGANLVTDNDGYIYIEGIELNNSVQTYVITEQSVPEGVTKLVDTQILLNIDTTGLTSPEQITKDRVTVSLVKTGASGVTELEGLSTTLEGSTVVLKIPNPTKLYTFGMYKTDELGTPLHSADGKGAANFTIRKFNNKKGFLTIHKGPLEGFFTKYEICGANTTYKYKIEETSPKLGYINILQGYNLYVYIETDGNANVKDTENNGRGGYTKYELERKENEEQLYTEEELINGGYINFSVNKGENSATINLYIKNPYAYNVTINKRSKNGDVPVNKATILAERIDGVKANDLFRAEQSRDTVAKQNILKEIVNSSNKSKEVKLDKNPTITSEEMEIKYNGSMMPLDGSVQTWRIKETDVQKPYINALGDNYIIVQTMYREGALHIVTHEAEINNSVVSLNYYVCDRNGNDITEQYLNIVDAKTEQIDGKWNLAVTVKDPLKFYVDLNKVEYNPTAESEEDLIALGGAELTITSNKGNGAITNGGSRSENIPVEINPYEVVQFTIKETKSAPGHKNILENKELHVMVRSDEKGNAKVVGTVVVDTSNGGHIEYNSSVLNYVKFIQGTTQDGYPIIHVYVENPIEYKFKLQKQDAAGNPLTGTEIEVSSSHSGKHYLNEANQMEFVESNLKPGDIISYNIREIRTVKDSAYVNVFSRNMTMIVRVNADGTIKEVMSFYMKPSDHGSPDMTPISELDFLDYGISDSDSDGIQTINFILQNPTKIDVELLKTQAGEDGASIAGTDFTIISSFSGEHSKLTDSNGKIGFTENTMRPGKYTYRIMENNTADPNYVNVLEGKYMQVDITVTANGEITIDDTKYYYLDDDDNYNNDRQITDSELLKKLQKYAFVDKDDTNPVQKLLITIKNPVTINFNLYKETTDGRRIENVTFGIKSKLSGWKELKTDENGKITLDDDMWIEPGVYKYEVTEYNPTNKQYNNIFKSPHQIVIYAKVSPSGLITFVADENGTEFAKGTKYKYSVETTDGSQVDENVVDTIHKYVTLLDPNVSNDKKDSINLIVINPTGYKMDIIKKNSAGNDLGNTKFTVIRDNQEVLLNNGIVSGECEIEEKYLSHGLYTFNITENSTQPRSAYVNILEGKFVRVYAQLSGTGILNIKRPHTNTVENYFEIYEGNIRNPSGARLLDRKQFAYLYDLISVRSADDDKDGVYTLEVEVTNPINIDVEILKKQVGKDGVGIPNTKFTITRDENNKHENILTDDDGQYNFTEERIIPGDYTYKVEELETASPKYINILKGKYLEVYVTVQEDGYIKVNGQQIFNSDGSRVDANIENTLNKYINVDVNRSQPTHKLVVTIYNPVTIDFNLYKEDISGGFINGANFTINRTLVRAKSENSDKSTKIVTRNTENQGSIEIDEGWIDPGIYKYEVRENNTAGPQYTNILKNCKIVAYVEVAENGDITLVANEYGTKFSSLNKYNYYIEGLDGSVVDAETQNIIHEYVSIVEHEANNSNDEVDLTVINPVEYKLDIIKKDQRDEALSGTKFTVTRDNNIKVIDNQDITTAVELTEKYLNDGEHTYYITEDSTVPGYINILNGKFIKVYTELTGTGVLKVKDSEFNTAPNYFEVYEGSIDNVNAAKLLDKTEYSDLYEKIHVESVKEDGVYILKVKVENPDITYNLDLNKKIFGNEHINLSNTRFTVISQFSGRHAGLYTDRNGNISIKEERVPAGTYRYLITETRTSGKQFVNILKDNTYIEVMLKVNEDGTIEIVDEDGNSAENTYYLYKQRENSSLLDKLDFADTVADEFINVNTSVKNKTPVLDIFIKDPEIYNFELIKIDKDTKEKMNGVEFTLNVFDENNNKVELKDGETLEKLINGKLITKNVNGVDGVITIPKILIEKAGKYTFVLHEESTEGLFDCLYKSWATDIKVKVEIVVQNGKYVIKTPTITQGEKYVETVNTTTSKSQVAQVEVTNERIKGSYNLIIDKLDSYTNRTLNGAEFDVTVEKDGQEYVLYKSTDDVTSKDVIIPGKVTVNGELTIPNIRIERPETYTIILTETKAPKGYMLLDNPIKIEVTTARNGEYDDEEYIVESAQLIDDENHGLVTVDNDDKVVNITAKNEYFDLSLRKSITSVSYNDSEDGKITEDETKDRVPDVITTDLLANKDTTADYNHVKNHVRAYTSQEVIYTLRVYNEGEIDGYAEEITDHLPEGLEFVNDDFNAERGWILDENDPTLRTVKTTYLSKDKNPEKNLIKAMDKVTGELDYKEIQIKCKISDNVKAKTVLTNIAEISRSKAEGRTSETVDRDSVTNNVKVPETSEEMSGYQENNLTDNRNDYVPGQEDDDDFEKLIVEEFDLALRKYIVAVNDEELLKNNEENTEDKTNNTNENDTIYEREPVVNVDSLKDGSSTTATYTHTKEPVEVSVGDIVTYTLEVYNEGTVSGYASLIKDDIPEGLEFVTYTEGDGSTNDIYRWKMVDENDNEVTDPTKAKYVISDYLSKANEVSENGNLINAYDPSTMSTVDSKYVRVAFRVVCKQDYPKIIKNEAQISEDTDESGKSVTDRDSTPNEWKGEDDEDVEYVRVTYMDLALRKFITAVKDEVTGEEKEVTTRIPQVDASALINETGTTAKYTHPKDPVLVHTTDVVTYTIRVYNEGSKDGYATQIKDDIPDGLEFLPNHEINKEYEWKLLDENDNYVTDLSKAKYVVTNYRSKDNETQDRQNLMKAFDKETMTEPEYKDVKVAFKVIEPSTSDRILINYAQISEQTDGKGIHREDRDSVPNKWQGEDDEDIEKVRVQYFDLALRKWVTKAIVIQNGAENVTETGHHAEDDPEEVVKVDLKKSKLNSVVVKFEYQIRITNEGEIAGYAKEVKDHIPDGLKFEAVDNQNWVQLDDKTIVTDELKDTLLQPGESAEVTVVLTWINSETNMGVKVNIAEISEDYNDYGTPDIDSTPNNEVPGEDDIDDAPVMLTIKTGSNDLRNIVIALGVLAILGLSVSLIKDERKRKLK